jgi:hypothetical protein
MVSTVSQKIDFQSTIDGVMFNSVDGEVLAVNSQIYSIVPITKAKKVLDRR